MGSNVFIQNLQNGDLADHHLHTVVNKTWNYAGKLKSREDEVLNAVLGLVGEAGEVADLHKKMLFHATKPGLLAELLLEMGDVLYYFNKLRDLYGFSMEAIVEANREKLFERHKATLAREGLCSPNWDKNSFEREGQLDDQD